MTASRGEGWLLHLNGGLRAAVGIREMLFVLPKEPIAYKVPRAPVHAGRVILWQEQPVPLIDLYVYLRGTQPLASQMMIGVVACAAGAEANPVTRFGALILSRPPERIEVADEQACGLPKEPVAWRSIAASCFRHPVHGAVPILDLASLLTPCN